MTRLELQHRLVETNGIVLHIAEQGEGPPVILCHGFPGLWYSWRHQLPALARAGFRAVAVDMRGYGRSSVPERVADYDMDRVSADLLGLLDALGEERAVFVGHDFGAPVVWNLALRAPERVAAVAALSVPYDFDYYGRGGRTEAALRPSEAFALAAREGFLHAHYFQREGPADAELNARPREFLRRLYWALGSRGDYLRCRQHPSAGSGYLDTLPDDAPPLPWPWFTGEDLDFYAGEFQRTGFSGGLNWYRVADRNWELGERFVGVQVTVPALFIVGRQDPVLRMIPDDALESMRRRVPRLSGVVMVDDAGHWVQQEQPQRVNETLLRFLSSIGI